MFPWNNLFAQQTEIKGVVKDSVATTTVEGAVVKAVADGKTVAFAITDKTGKYKLTFENPASQLLINFKHLCFHDKSVKVENKSQQLNALIRSKEITLREVTVKAPEIIVKKDTISYNVGSFTTANDRSIEDVIKKMPGVEVAENGMISYQGKGISKFNIEGLDMLGGKYTLATRNVQAKDVNRVEIKENYQEIKQLEGREHSDNVAMNLKLKNEAKMRLLGKMELGVGYREDESLYHGEVTAMTFGKKVQFIGTLKANNFGASLANQIAYHYDANDIYNVANNLINDDLSASAPLPHNRYRQKNDLLTSLNSIIKLSEDKTLRVNTDYIRQKNNFRYEISKNYYLGNSNVEIKEIQEPEYLTNQLTGSVNYNINNAKLYIDNTTYCSAKDVNNHFGLNTNGNRIQQDKTKKLLGLKNNFSFLKRTNKTQYNFNSVINYSHLPDNRLNFTAVPGVLGEYYQRSNGESFFTKEAVSFGYDLSKISKLSIAADIRMDYDKVFANSQRNDSVSQNQNDGYKIVTSIWPEYRLLSIDQRYGFTLGMPINMYNINFKNRINTDADFSYNRVYFNPWINAHYVFSAFTKLNIDSRLNTSIGDIGDFIINPIQSSYNQQTRRSGILAKSDAFSSNLRLEYKNPLKLFFANGSIAYGATQRNILSSQTISSVNGNVDISSSGIANKNIAQNISTSGSISKNVRSIASSFSLNAYYGITTGSQVRQGIKTDIQNNSYNISPNVRTLIAKKIELNYYLSFSQSTLTASNYKTIYHNQSQNLNLAYNPTEKLVFYASMNYVRNEIVQNNYINMQFLDAGAKYKYKKFEVELMLNNLLNMKEYSYTLVNELDKFSYHYFLNPREIVLVCKFDL